MRKLIAITIVSFLVVSCSSYRTLDLSRLTTGMTKAEVISAIGKPQRILAVNDTKDGYQEVLEYRTARDEIYALEFWNDYLTGYEFLYDDIEYIPSVVPPVWYPDYGRPIVIYPGNNINRPNRPNRPNPNRPSQPNQPNQPNQPSRPETPRPTPNRQELTRPTPGVGPGSSSTTKPSTETESSSGSTTTTRPAVDRSETE